MNEPQQRIFEIMKAFDRFCRENDISYSLIGGSMLGAVRHGGFIPWDDDADFGLIRSEYDKFISCAKECDCKIGRFEVKLPEHDAYFYPFIKVVDPRTVVHEDVVREMFPLGIWIDVFPMDYVDTNESANKIEYYKRKQITKEMMRYVAHDHNPLKALLRRPYLLYLKYIKKKDWRSIKRYLAASPECGDRNYIGLYTWPINEKVLFPVEYVANYSEILFEGYSFRVFSSVHDILSAHYGDYMKLPPVEERRNHIMSVEEIN